MEQKVEETAPEPQVEAEEAQPEGPIDHYDLHIQVPIEMRQKLKDAAELAHKLENIPKPNLVDLMNLFISWGMAVLKQEYLNRMGYR